MSTGSSETMMNSAKTNDEVKTDAKVKTVPAGEDAGASGLLECSTEDN